MAISCCGAQNLLFAFAPQILTAAPPFCSLFLPQAALANVPDAGTIVILLVARGILDAPDGSKIILKMLLFRDVEDAVPNIRDKNFLHGASGMPRATLLFEQCDKSKFAVLTHGAFVFSTKLPTLCFFQESPFTFWRSCIIIVQ